MEQPAFRTQVPSHDAKDGQTRTWDHGYAAKSSYVVREATWETLTFREATVLRQTQAITREQLQREQYEQWISDEISKQLAQERDQQRKQQREQQSRSISEEISKQVDQQRKQQREQQYDRWISEEISWQSRRRNTAAGLEESLRLFQETFW